MTAIAKFRKAAGMTQQDLADKLDVTQGAVCQWENGNAEPRLSVVRAMAKLFGCSVDDLLDG